MTTDSQVADLIAAREEWIGCGRPLPLEVSKSCYDDTTRSWEVLYIDSPWDGNTGCSTPIAEFAEWQDAQDWAVMEARKSTMRADSRRTLGPLTRYQQARDDAWAAYEAGTGPHPSTNERERLAML